MPLSTFLDGREYTQLRGLAWLSLSDTGNWMTMGGSSDSGGGVTATWGTAGTAVPCRIDPLTGTEGLAGEKVDDRSTHAITLPPGTDIDSADRFEVGSRLFEVTAVRDRTREWLRVLEAVEL